MAADSSDAGTGAREPGESGAADAARPYRAGAGAAAARLDIRSAEFDAAAALVEGAVLPLDVFPLENLARARALLPEWHPDHVRPRASGGPPSAAAFVRAEISSMLREERARTKAAYVCPLDALVYTFTAGPLGALRAMCEGKERVRVTTRRVDGVRGTVNGMLRAFDRHWNLLLLDAEEEFRIVEFAEVSADGSARPLQGRVARFMAVYCPDKVANSGAIAAKYRGNEGELWAFLQQKYGLLARVQTAVGTLDKAREQLSRYAGREPVLMAKLGIAEQREKEAKFGNAASRDLDDDDDVARAEWIRKPSEKYPGRFFYYNTRTRKRYVVLACLLEAHAERARNKLSCLTFDSGSLVPNRLRSWVGGADCCFCSLARPFPASGASRRACSSR